MMTPTRRYLPSVTLRALFALLLLIAVSVTAAVHAAAKPSESQERGGPAFASDATWSPQHLRWTLSAEEMTYRFTRQPAVSVADTSEHLSSRDPQQPQSVSTRSVFRTLLTVDLKKRFQSIVGFGGAVTEAAADNIAQLPEDVQEAIAEAYFGPTGNRYSLIRVPINSCDFSPSSYSFDDKWDDVDLLAFDSRVQHDNRTMLPFIQRALRHSSNGIRLFASPWSPPAWMKNNYQMTGSSNPCLRSNDAYHRAWANYFVKFIRAYESYGVHFWGLTVQNEPEFAAPWEACTYTAEQQRDFVADFLGPIVHDAYPNVNIMTYDHNKDHVVAFTDVVYADERASKHLWGSAVHWYSGDQFDQLAVLHDKWPNKHILATEACHCPNVHLNSWKRAELYAHDVIGDLNNFVTGWTDWNLVLDQHGGPNHLGNMCDSPMIARLDFDPPTVHFQPMYYFLAHFTRFLPPGSVRIEHRLKGLSKDGDGSRQQQQQQASQQHDLGAASMSAPQSADPFASGGTGLEVVTFLVDPKATGPVESPHGDTGKHVVIVVQNPTDRAEELVLQLSATRSSLVEIPAHSLSTFTARAEWFE